LVAETIAVTDLLTQIGRVPATGGIEGGISVTAGGSLTDNSVIGGRTPGNASFYLAAVSPTPRAPASKATATAWRSLEAAPYIMLAAYRPPMGFTQAFTKVPSNISKALLRSA
jgi:hypothetical protein